MPSVSVTVPYPPTTNRLWRPIGRKLIRTKEYEKWRMAAAWIVQTARKGVKIDGPYTVTFQVGRPDKRPRDIDNLLKPLSDALMLGGAITDDCHCQRIEAEWVPGIEGVHCLVLATKDRLAA